MYNIHNGPLSGEVKRLLLVENPLVGRLVFPWGYSQVELTGHPVLKRIIRW